MGRVVGVSVCVCLCGVGGAVGGGCVGVYVCAVKYMCAVGVNVFV